MKITETKLKGVLLIEPAIYADERGEIVKPFVNSELPAEFKQVYYTHSTKGIIRGMCYCKADKLVYCTKGKVLDVILDIKTGDFISWELSAENHLALFIPAGYAHGYQCLEDSTFNYLQTKEWSPDDEKKVGIDSFGFEWPQ